MKNYFMLLKFTLVLLVAITSCRLTNKDANYGVGEWNADSLGNHRAVVKISEETDAALAHIEWRRRDYNPENKEVIVVDAKTGKRVLNVFRANINREFGDFVFQPKTIPGTYYFYFMPYSTSGSRNNPTISYRKPENTADKKWLADHKLVDKNLNLAIFPKAQMAELQSIDEFNSFYPMEMIATKEELKTLLSENKGAKYLLFTEQRDYPIRMTNDLPQRWIQKGVRKDLKDTAMRGEYFTFQVGVYAVADSYKNIKVTFSDLKKGTSKITAENFTCFNTEGVDAQGQPFTKPCPVAKGKVQALWCGVQIPSDIETGQYTAQVSIQPEGCEAQLFKVVLNINSKVLSDNGDNETSRLSRLRWLNSKIGIDDGIVAPYKAMTFKDSAISCLGRTVRLNQYGFPRSIQSFFDFELTKINDMGREILSSPIQLIVEKSDFMPAKFVPQTVKFTKQTEGSICWETAAKSDIFALNLAAAMEFDGCIEYKVTLTATTDASINDIRLQIPFQKEVAEYAMGMGLVSGKRPDKFDWKWDVKKNQDAIWIGDINAGIQASFRDENYSRPLNNNLYLQKPLLMPTSWANNGKGGVSTTLKDNVYQLTAFSGQRKVKKGEKLSYNFRLLVSPFHTLQLDNQWKTRYYHGYKSVEDVVESGSNTINIHHATEINPFLNYPFLKPKEMKEYIDKAHAKSLKVKLYYTSKELSNRASEIFVLQSLNDEVFAKGKGNGAAWLQEHLDTTYIASWYVPEQNDAAIAINGGSRWNNYYIEGLNYLTKNQEIDGVYLDDANFDRTTMKRVRKILDRNRKDAIIDFQSANQNNAKAGFASSASLHLEHFPYLNRLCFGEQFDYNSKPDFWLLESSGIPFGLMGEMLQEGSNAYRGMLYGMTCRLGWAGSPQEIWKVWDKFGIAGSRMIGYWVPYCPVKTDNPNVLATVYIKDKKTLLVIASWAKEKTSVKLSFDWTKLGLDPAKAKLIAPAIKDLQSEVSYSPTDALSVDSSKGWIFVLEEK